MKKNFVLGTAGHIDHGKTTLIKRLTGIDADRFEEEKKRGITIDLGFAYFDLPDGNRVGIVDVPGHERFIKNMLAGASGIDIIMFIVAADEGIMPQTIEHLDIIDILGVKKAMFVVNKIDLVDEEMLMLVDEEILSLTEGTSFENPIIKHVSAATGENMDDLIEEIHTSFKEIEYKEKNELPRLPIDRVFVITGFGTVVTGTLIDGSISVGDTLYIYPEEKEVKVKNIQVHSSNVETAYHGQRVAINLQGISKDEIKRGDVLSSKDALTKSMMIDAKIRVLDRSPYEIKNWTRLRLYHGTKEILCRVVLLDSEVLKPGEEAYVQLRLEDTISAKYNDHFVLRFYSPMMTVAGGIILDPVANKHKRFKDDVISDLKLKEESDIDLVVEKLILDASSDFDSVYDVVRKLNLQKEILDDMLKDMDSVIVLDKDVYVHSDYISNLEDDIVHYLEKYHKKNPLNPGVGKEEFRQKYFSKIKGKSYEKILEILVSHDIIEYGMNLVKLKGFEIKLNPKQKETIDWLEKSLVQGEFQPPSIAELKKSKPFSKKELDYLINNQKIVKISEEMYFGIKAYNSSKESLVKYLEENNEISLAQFRDLLGTSRKVAMGLLEHFDLIKVTKRIENIRKLI